MLGLNSVTFIFPYGIFTSVPHANQRKVMLVLSNMLRVTSSSVQVPRVSTEPPEHESSLSIPNEDPNKSLLYFPNLPSPSKLHPLPHTHTVFGDFGPVEANKDILIREYVLKITTVHPN